MELHEIKPLWQMYDARLEKTLKLNRRFVELIGTQKMKSDLRPLFWRRLAEVVIQTAAIFLLLAFLRRNLADIRYAASAGVLLVFYGIAFINSVKQLVVIKRMDYSHDIVTIQGSLVMLQANNLHYARMVILCIPAFLAFPTVVTKALQDLPVRGLPVVDMIELSNGYWWKAQLVCFLSLVPVSIWFYSQVSYKNIHKKWVQDFILKSSGKKVRKAAEFMKELDSLKNEVV